MRISRQKEFHNDSLYLAYYTKYNWPFAFRVLMRERKNLPFCLHFKIVAKINSYTYPPTVSSVLRPLHVVRYRKIATTQRVRIYCSSIITILYNIQYYSVTFCYYLSPYQQQSSTRFG